jgi:cell division protein FtsW
VKKNLPPPRIDYLLLFITAVLLVIGTVMVFSASVIMAEARWQTPYLFVIKHVIWVTLGTGVMLFLSQYDYRDLQKLARPLIAAGVILLILVLVIGTEKSGARRWFQFGPVSFQPSELAKLIFVIALADFLDRRKSKLAKWKGLLPALALIGVFDMLIGLEPDLGTPIIITTVGLGLLYMAGARIGHLLILGACVLPAVALEILRKPYRLQRVQDFLQNWGEIQSASYQLNQSILALGSGGFFGKGLAHSQMKLLYLPEPHTDFIFPIVGEELGFIGAILLLALFLAFAWRGWQISRGAPDYFGGMLAMGITWLVAVQALLNVGVASGLLPTKGLPLPFVSFGGTALVFTMAGVGILLSISKRSKHG